MAFCLHSAFLSSECNSLYSTTQFTSNGRFPGRRMDAYNGGGLVMVKLWSNCKRPTHNQLLRNSRLYCRLDSSFYDILSNGRAKIFSLCNIEAVIKSKHRFNPEATIKLIAQRQWSQFAAVALVLACTLVIIPNAYAVDALKTCTCLLKECRVELAKCIANPSCAANVACLQTCNNRPDETECQIKCGDLFENSVVDQFNECAVSRKKCVPRKSDVGEFPVPAADVLVKSFNFNDFTGKWFITSGLNPTFDAFDCQLHEFYTEGNKLVGNLSWRIGTPDGGFFNRSAVQKFVQDPSHPGILYNHDNEYLHYEDDWYVLSSKLEGKPEDYLFVYYRGKNDAWDGYGGAFVYTRSAVLPESIVPELEKAAKNVGRDFNTFIRTNNTCGPEPPLIDRLEKTAEAGERTLIREVEEIEEEVEKVKDTEVNLFRKLAEGFKVFLEDEENIINGLSKEEEEILNGLQMEAAEVEKLFENALPIRKLR